MARSTEEIIEGMDEAQAGQTALSGLTSTSQTAIYKLWKYIFGQAANILEQLWDSKRSDLASVMDAGAPCSITWVRTKVFEFQYDATTPQVMELDSNLVPRYAVVDETKRIITRCCVSGASGVTTVTVAKNDPPEKLTAPELAALQGYFANTGDGTNQAVGIGYAGQSIACYTDDPDLLFLEATITYLGSYASTIEDACILAIEEYISELGQNPVIKINTLINHLQEVPGFVDIHIANMSARADGGAFPGTNMVVAGDWVALSYTAAAGYMIGETTAGETFTDKITFTAI